MNYYLQNNRITFVLCQMQICRLAQRGVLKGLVPHWILDEAGARSPIADRDCRDGASERVIVKTVR
jgi:hypothetical protein